MNKAYGACHCGMCRKWGGGPFLAVDCGQEVNISGEENVTTYASSEWAERAFCKHCGSNLYYRVVETGEHYVCAGLLDETDGLVLEGQIFIDEKPAFYDFANETKNMTGAEVFAAFAPPPKDG